jgi:pimeloyl-ACP methyl ester carboxylesterase
LVEEEKEVLVAVVNGGAEPFLDLDYLDQICWGRLWRAECVRLGELGHAPFWEDPGLFMPFFEEFVGDCVARMGEGED